MQTICRGPWLTEVPAEILRHDQTMAPQTPEYPSNQHTGMPSPYMSNYPPMAEAHPSLNPFAVPHVITNQQPDLYIVAFKCCRADVYYVPANSGLHPKAGELVVVEGDRGVDLGTVTHARISVEEARRLKAEATAKHFQWLMVFSRTMKDQPGATLTTGLLANTNGDKGSAVGGMGPRVPLPTSVNHPNQIQTRDEDLKPKALKRIAFEHEIQQLREKEAAEAKAKRVCSTKVNEHGLNMEILDAEFQL